MRKNIYIGGPREYPLKFFLGIIVSFPIHKMKIQGKRRVRLQYTKCLSFRTIACAHPLFIIYSLSLVPDCQKKRKNTQLFVPMKIIIGVFI